MHRYDTDHNAKKFIRQILVVKFYEQIMAATWKFKGQIQFNMFIGQIHIALLIRQILVLSSSDRFWF